MEVSKEARAGLTGGGGSARQPVAEAEQLFAALTEQAEQQRNGFRPLAVVPTALEPPAPPPPEVSAPPPPAVPAPVDGEVRPVAAPELLGLVRAALDATDRIAEVVDDLGSTVDATAVDVPALGRAIEQALDATNERLAFLEHILLDEAAPGVEASDQAMARLRRTLRRSAERSEGGA